MTPLYLAVMPGVLGGISLCCPPVFFKAMSNGQSSVSLMYLYVNSVPLSVWIV